ncbi:MAG: type II toxin-antitoxin system PemK/MazF family toxin [bacterium]
MGLFTVGDIVIIPFPYSDMSKSKLRPALIVGEIDKKDYIMLQITSKSYDDKQSIIISKNDLSSGNLNFDSYVKYSKIFTGSDTLVVKVIGTLRPKKVNEIISLLVELLERNKK